MTTSTETDARGVVESCPNCRQRNRVPFWALGGLAKCGRCSAPLPALAAPINVEDEGPFQALTSTARIPVLVDFWAEWCGPCKMMAPELERLAAKNAGRLIVAKANTEMLPSVAQAFQIAAIPTLVLFRRGAELGRIQGARPAAQVQQFVDGFEA